VVDIQNKMVDPPEIFGATVWRVENTTRNIGQLFFELPVTVLVDRADKPQLPDGRLYVGFRFFFTA
jgi:hypothetical protein